MLHEAGEVTYRISYHELEVGFRDLRSNLKFWIFRGVSGVWDWKGDRLGSLLEPRADIVYRGRTMTLSRPSQPCRGNIFKIWNPNSGWGNLARGCKISWPLNLSGSERGWWVNYPTRHWELTPQRNYDFFDLAAASLTRFGQGQNNAGSGFQECRFSAHLEFWPISSAWVTCKTKFLDISTNRFNWFHIKPIQGLNFFCENFLFNKTFFRNSVRKNSQSFFFENPDLSP